MAFKNGEFEGFVGQAYEAPDPFQDRQVCVNYYPEISGDKHSKTVSALLSAPGKLKVVSIFSAIPLTITTTALISGNSGQPYRQLLAATMGSPPYSWLLLADPQGSTLVVSPAGFITGVPVVYGVINLKVQVTDSLNNVAVATLSGNFANIGPTVPVAPTIGIAVAGNAQATVSWTLNANGGSTITSVIVYSSDGTNHTTYSINGPYVYTGETNGVAVSYAVKAVNAVGLSAQSANSNVVTPAVPLTVPGAPTNVVATAGAGSAALTWTAPTNTGGSANTGYTVTSAPATSTRTYAAGVTSGTFSGLTNTVAYYFNVTALNAQGPSVPSANSNTVTPMAVATVPGVPTAPVATAGNTTAALTTTAPSSGGSAITSYQWVSTPATSTQSSSGTSYTFTGLTDGTAYTFAVEAINAVGASGYSSASNSVTPTAPSGSGLTMVTQSLQAARAGRGYFGALQVYGGTFPYTYSGGGTYLSLSSTGQVLGFIPTGTTSDTVSGTVTDSASHSVTFSFPVTVTTPSGALSVSAVPTTANGTLNGAFHMNLNYFVTGGTGRYIWAISSQSGSSLFIINPTGTTLQSVNLAATGTNTVNLTCTDDSGTTGTVTMVVTVDGILRLYGVDYGTNTGRLPNARLTAKYRHSILGLGGSNSGITASVVSGALPTGLTLSTLLFSGTPTASGTFTFGVQLTDSASNTSSAITYTMIVLPNLNVTRPSYNTGTGFFVLNGKLYEPNGIPYSVRGINITHYDSGPVTYLPRTSPNTCRIFFPADGSVSLSTLSSSINSYRPIYTMPVPSMSYVSVISQTLTAAAAAGTTSATMTAAWGYMTGTYYFQFTRTAGGNVDTIACALTLGSTAITFGATSYAYNAGIGTSGTMSGEDNCIALGFAVNYYCNTALSSIQAELNPYGAINIANEWTSGNFINGATWAAAYTAVSGTIHSIVGTTITISNSTNPINATAAFVQYMYIAGAGGVTNQCVRITATGGSAGAWTFTMSSAITGYTSGGVLWAGAIGVMRAAGYTCPLVIDAYGYGQDETNTLTYSGSILNSDPMLNSIMSYHAYGDTTNYEMPLSSITKGSPSVLHYSIPTVYLNTAQVGTLSQYGGSAYVTGVSGLTGVNGITATTGSASGSPSAYTLNWSENSSTLPGTASGGYVYDEAYFELRLSKIGAKQSQGECWIIGEFGPCCPPLQNNDPSPTTMTTAQLISAAENCGIGWLYWAFDDGTGGANNSLVGDFAAAGVNSTSSGKSYYVTPANLTYEGGDVILNPAVSYMALASPASAYQ